MPLQRGPRTPADLRSRCPGCNGIKRQDHIARCRPAPDATAIVAALTHRLVAAGYRLPEGWTE